MQESSQLRDLMIAGVSTVGGGSFHHVRVDGVGKLNGDVDCLSMTINGTLKMKGSIQTEELNVSGIANFEGKVEAEQIRVDGMATIRGNVSGSHLVINGKNKIEGHVEGDKVQVDGMISVHGDVQCEQFTSRGNSRISGLLNAEGVDIQLQTQSSIKEIGCERVFVRRMERGGLWRAMTLVTPPQLKAELIEGDEVYLEDTQADTVRGVRVVIGRGCKIRKVEYQESLEVDPDAKVGSQQQV